MMHAEPVRALCLVGWEIKLCAENLGQRGTPGWCPQPSLSLDFFALGFFCGAEGGQTLSHSSVRTPLKSQWVFQEIPILGRMSSY